MALLLSTQAAEEYPADPRLFDSQLTHAESIASQMVQARLLI